MASGLGQGAVRSHFATNLKTYSEKLAAASTSADDEGMNNGFYIKWREAVTVCYNPIGAASLS